MFPTSKLELEDFGDIFAGPVRPVEDLVGAIRDRLGVKHVIYHAARMGAGPVDDPWIRLTYSAEWVRRYLTNNYMRVDPVIREGFQRTLPFFWWDVRTASPQEEAFFLDAMAHRVGFHGLSVPLRDKNGRRALFTVSSDMEAADFAEWATRNRRLVVDLAHMIHALAVIEQEGIGIDNPPLTRREQQVLYWSGQGKTAADIAVILGLANHTVTTYLRSARFKLNAISITHAVYKAMQAGLIDNVVEDQKDDTKAIS